MAVRPRARSAVAGLPVVEQRAPASECRDHDIPCLATVFGEPEAHPVAALVTRFHADLDELEDPRLWSLSDADLARVLPELTRLAQRVVALELAAAHQAGTRDLGTDTGATDTAA